MLIKINEVLKRQNRSLLWLSKQTGMTYASLHRLANGQTKKVEFKILENICNTLDCQLSDILILESPTKKDQ